MQVAAVAVLQEDRQGRVVQDVLELLLAGADFLLGLVAGVNLQAEFRRAFFHALFEFVVRTAQFLLDGLAAGDLALQEPVAGLKLAGTRHRQHARHDLPERSGREKRGGGGERFRHPHQAIDRIPHRDHVEHVRDPAGADKHAEHDEDPIKGHAAPLAHEVQQSDGDREVSERDQGIGKNVQPEHTRLPQVTVAVRHEVGREEQPAKEVEHEVEADLYGAAVGGAAGVQP